MRQTIRAAVPEATETISYRGPQGDEGLPPVLERGQAKEHCSFFLMGYIPPELEGELEKYDTGKGTIRFPVDESLPASLVRKVVKARMAKVEASTGYGRARS